MFKKSLIIIVILTVLVGGSLLVWRVQDTRAKAAKAEKMESEILKELTAEEISLILSNQAESDGAGVAGIVENAETRQMFLKGIREYLALAAQARREGMAEDPKFKINLERQKDTLLAKIYHAKLSKEQGNIYVVSKEEMDAVWANQENEKQFNVDIDATREIQMATARERGDSRPFPKLQGESLTKVRDTWARTKILADKAKSEAEFTSKPEIQLRFRMVEAGILSADYLRKYWTKEVKATDQEIAAYLAAHPEYNLSKKLEKAETVLQRAKAGEDFDKLAREFSEDRSTKNKGGLYENVEKDYLWIEVETAALALEKGQIADKLIETHTGYHIVKLDNKTTEKEKIKYSVRHILLQKYFEEPTNNPDIPPPFVTAEEIAKAQIEKEKRNKFVNNVTQLNKIILPDDFTVELSKGSTGNADVQ